MLQVPYTPVPSVDPISPGEKISVNTPGAAFGENIGAALQHLGATGEQVGNELFQRAIALQDLANENAARSAQTDFALKASQMHADYGALTGQAAKDALPKFLNDQASLRTQIRGGLSSPMAQRIFDADSLPFMQRNVFSAASHAAEENKKYTIETLGSAATNAEQAAALHPDDAPYVEQQREAVRDRVTQAAFLKYGVHDPNDPNVVKDVNNALSAQRREQIAAKINTDAIVGGQWAKKYAADLTNPADRDYIDKLAENKGAVVAGSHIAADVLASHRQPDGSYDASSKDMEDEVRNRAKTVLPDNEYLPDTAVAKLQGLLWHDNFFAKQEQADAKQRFNDALAKGDIKDVQTLMAMPGMDKVIPKLPPDLRTAPQLQSYMNRFYAGENKITNERAATMINGMKNSDAAAFMAIDPTNPEYHLSKGDIIRVQNEQAEMARNPKDDPRVTRAVNWLLGARGSELQALGVDKFDKANPDDYYHFRGALQEALQIWQEDHNGKPPTYEEVVDKIGPSVIKTQTNVPGFFSIFGHGTTREAPAFQQYNRPSIEDVPQEVRDKITKDFQDKGVAAPTDRELVQVYARQQFNKLYKGSATKKEEK
jgi:hypothetical protein